MPGPSTPAPDRLETVRAFVNTLDIDMDEDRLSTPDDLRAWLLDASLAVTPLEATAGGLRRALALREAIRAALAANHSRTSVPVGALKVINATAARAKLGLELTADAGWAAHAAAPGIDGALGVLVVIAIEAMNDGTWSRLKVCVNDNCRWAFYDTSRARSGRWCSMQICGNRAKQQSWWARHNDPAH